MSATLEIRHGTDIRYYPLSEGRDVTIGRADDNDLVLEDPLVSRHHAKLRWTAGSCTLTDLGSANGTRVDGSEISPREPQTIARGQAIQIGSFTLALGDSEATGSGQAPSLPAHEDDAFTFVIQPEPRLIVTTPDWTREFPLKGERVVLGRTPENDIVVDAAVVSRQHAELTRTDGRWSIADLNSTNGISFQGDLVTSRTLADGDVLWIADAVSIKFRMSPLAAEEEEEAPVERLELRGRREVTIGRHQSADITVSHPTVSRLHARLTLRDGRYVIEDLASSNGTYVNGVAVEIGEPRTLQPGDSIRIGPARFDFSEDALRQVDESKDLRLDALHLNQPVGKGINLLQDISLSINPREFVAVVGVSGAGKSTLLDALNGFRPAGQGAVLVNGTDLYRNFDAYRNELGYVPQDDIIHKELPVQSALEYAAKLRLPSDTTPTERTERVEEVLATLGLNERRHIPIARLSGGQRKRVSIGAELLTKPGLFYLDEATSGLDPGTESQLMRLLRRLADGGHTILLITHATKNVMLCDQVIFLAKGGNLAFFGPPDEALKHFGVEDFDGIYEKLEEESTPEEWAQRYKHSDAYRRCVAERLNAHYGAGATPVAPATDVPPAADQPVTPKRPEKAPRNVSMLRQFWILSSRYLSIIRRDKTNLALMFAIAPLLGAIDLLAWERNVLDPVDGDSSTSMTMLFMAALIPFLVGALTSVREIVKESPIYRRERTVTLKIAPYLLSKVWVGLLFALYHGTALFAMKMIAVDFPNTDATDLAQFWATVTLAAMSGVMWGLLISAVVPREEQAMVLVIAVVVLQMVFSGGLLPLSDLGFAGDILGSVTSTKWVFQGLASSAHVMQGDCFAQTLDNCTIPGLLAYETEAEKRVVVDPILEKFGGVFGENVYTTWAACGVILAVIFVVIIGLQKRKDVV